MSDNPFAEPDDDNRTIIRPNPGKRRQQQAETQAPTQAEPPSRREASAGRSAAVAEGTEKFSVGDDVLTAAAAPLLMFMARLRNTANPPDSGDLYQRTVRQIRVFEQETRDKGVPLEQLRPAHYALCASLDDVVLNTPWGSSGTWGERSLVSTFHQEVRSGERFFDVLKQMCSNPGKYLPVIKLMYLCMSLGFIGQYRLSRRGVGDINRIREETYAVIVRQQKAAEPDLAPHTKGIDAGLFLWFSIGLNATSDDLYARLQTAPPSRMPTITRTPVVEPTPAPTPPLPPEPTVLDRLRKFLQPEIDQGLVEVTGTVGQPLVRITGRGMFPSGSATVNPSFKPLLDRIGLALKEEPGTVRVIGYTTISRSARSPSRRISSSRRRRRRSGCPQGTHVHGPGAAEESAGHARLPLRATVVRHHRTAGRRQDNGVAEQRAEIPAGRRDGPGRSGGCRRHQALRLVVHRERRADRYGRPLYHPGFQCRRRSRGLGFIPRSAAPDPAAPAAERRHRRHRAQRHRRRTARRTRGPRCGDPATHQGTRESPGHSHSGLCAVHQGGSHRGLHRVLRRPRPRAAQPSMGRDVPAGQGGRRSRGTIPRRAA